MRLAFIDLVYSWPPLGGAPLDLHHTVSGLQKAGHEVCLFFSTDPERWDRGELNPETMPLPSVRLDFTEEESIPEKVAADFRAAVDPWKPDVVFLCFGFFLKPFLAEAFSDYPTIARYYAYEPACPRDYRIFLNGDVCTKNYLRTPDFCRKCTLKYLSDSVTSLRPAGYAKEYLLTQAYSPAYYDRLVRSIRQTDAIITYNQIGKAHLDGFHSNVHVIGGGVELSEFPYCALEDRAEGAKKIILMTGRSMDPAKGMPVLRAAGEILAKCRGDFEIWVTHGNSSIDSDWLKNVGWRDHAGIVQLYAESDICVVPSVWEEPFGLVAVEAMATGRAVCVARVGGLQNIPEEGVSGFVYDRFDSVALAERLASLLDSYELRRAMGDAGRRRVEDRYTWDKVIERNYPPLFESVMS